MKITDWYRKNRTQILAVAATLVFAVANAILLLKDFYYLSLIPLAGLVLLLFITRFETGLMCMALFTPFAMLRYVAAIANDGVLVTPHLILSDEPAEQVRLVEESTARELKRMMSYTASTQYNPADNFPGISYLCAKTGTAELGDGTSHAWFTGFLDDSEHPYAFVVLIERGGGGLQTAAPVANRILHAAIAAE